MTISTNIISINADGNVPDAGEVASNLFMRDVTAGAEDPQITVVINGVIYDAVVAGSARTDGAWAAQMARASLPDGDYIVTADMSGLAGPRLSVLDTSAGNNIAAILTLGRTGDIPNERISLNLGTPPNLLKLADSQYHHDSLAEPGTTWVAHSTRDPSSRHATITIRNSDGRIRVPSDLVLTPRVLLGALAKLPTDQVEETVEGLIAILDSRFGDPDLEVDADGEDEVDEESAQIV